MAHGVDAAPHEARERHVGAQHDAVHADEHDGVVEGVEGGLPLRGEHAGGPLGPARAQHGAHRRHQHGVHGPHQVRVGAGGEAHGAAARIVRRGGEVDDRRVGRALVRPQPPGHLDAVDVRQLHVEQHDVGLLAARVLQAVGAGRGLQHQEAVQLQRAPVGVPCVLVDADDQHALQRCRGAHRGVPRAAVGWRRPHTPRDDTGTRACLPSASAG